MMLVSACVSYWRFIWQFASAHPKAAVLMSPFLFVLVIAPILFPMMLLNGLLELVEVWLLKKRS